MNRAGIVPETETNPAQNVLPIAMLLDGGVDTADVLAHVQGHGNWINWRA